MDYLFDDETGEPTSTSLADIHDRRFVRIRTTLTRPGCIVVQVYDFGTVEPQSLLSTNTTRMSLNSEDNQHSRVVLTLRTSGSPPSLGTVKYEEWAEAIPVEIYLKKSLLSRYAPLINTFVNYLLTSRPRSNSRTFTMSDNQEYKWTSDPRLDHNWTVLTIYFNSTMLMLNPPAVHQFTTVSGCTLRCTLNHTTSVGHYIYRYNTSYSYDTIPNLNIQTALEILSPSTERSNISPSVSINKSFIS